MDSILGLDNIMESGVGDEMQAHVPVARVIPNPQFRRGRLENTLILMAENKSYYNSHCSQKKDFESWRCLKTSQSCCGRIHKRDGIYYLMKEHSCVDTCKMPVK